MQFKVNLHTHTTFSDGKNTPKEMVEAYKELGYGAVAITDHDVFTPPPDVEGITVLQGCEHTTQNGKPIEHWLEIRGEKEPPLKIKAHPCYSEDTEVLTEEGWKLFKDLTGNERIATLNPWTEEIEYHKPTKIIVQDYEGVMIHQKGKTIDLMVTPNHKVYIRRGYQGKKWRLLKTVKFPNNFELVEMKDCPKVVEFKQDAKWKGIEQKYFVLPSVKSEKHPITGYQKIYPERRIPMDEWLAFFGFWLAEGSAFELYRGNYLTIISQRDDMNELRDIIRKCGFSFYINFDENRGEYRIVIHDKQLYEYLKQFGHAKDKYIPRELLKLSRRQLTILYTWMMKGDGNKRRNTYSTSSKKLADDFQELLLKIGYAGVVKYDEKDEIYRVYINKKQKTPKVNTNGQNNRKEIYYKGKIYCVTIRNHIIYVRRNGKPVWCGNCRYGDTCLELQLGVQQGLYELIEATEHGTLYEYYTTCGIPYIYSDDAHSLSMVGKAWILVDAPSTSPDDIIRAIRAGNFVPGGSPPEGTPHPIPYLTEFTLSFITFVTTSWAVKSIGGELKEAMKELGKAAKGSIKESAIKLIERL